MKLTDKQQAYLMLLAFVLPAFIVWLTNGKPISDETSLRFLAAAVLSGILAFIKELADYQPKEK